MNNVELARTLSWRENALFKEGKERSIAFTLPDVYCLYIYNSRLEL